MLTPFIKTFCTFILSLYSMKIMQNIFYMKYEKSLLSIKQKTLTYVPSNQQKRMLFCLSANLRLPRIGTTNVNKFLLYKQNIQSKGRKSKITDIKLGHFFKRGINFVINSPLRAAMKKKVPSIKLMSLQMKYSHFGT